MVVEGRDIPTEDIWLIRPYKGDKSKSEIVLKDKTCIAFEETSYSETVALLEQP